MTWLHPLRSASHWFPALDGRRRVLGRTELTIRPCLYLDLAVFTVHTDYREHFETAVCLYLSTLWWLSLWPSTMFPLLHPISPQVCQWGRSPLAAWCCERSPGRWSSRRPGGPTGTGCMCLTGTTPGGRGRPGSHPYSLSEHPGGMEGGERRSKQDNQYFLDFFLDL